MERKGSSSASRSPSLSRRPSFKDRALSKGGGVVVLAKLKRREGGSSFRSGERKKERWLLTRKTWRYMTDAVGNLLPEYRGQGGGAGGQGGSGQGSRRGSTTTGGRGGLGSPPPGQLQPHQLAQWTMQQQQWVQQHMMMGGVVGGAAVSSTFSTTPISSTGHVPGPSSPPYYAGGGGGGGKATSPPSSSAFPWPAGSFPSHRPGVTPTGPGPGGLQGHAIRHQFGGQGQGQGGQGGPNKYINPNVDPENIPQVEQHFQEVCSKEKKFLLWTRNKAKGLSGPALREQRLQREERRGHGGHGGGHGGQGGLGKDPFLGGTEEASFFGEEEGEYDEYGDQEEDQLTVRERRKSSTASTTLSILGGPGYSFFRPLGSGCLSETSYTLLGTRVLRNTGVQTDPFPEELLIRLRLQAVQEDRQKFFSSPPHDIGQGQGQGQGQGGQGHRSIDLTSSSSGGTSTSTQLKASKETLTLTQAQAQAQAQEGGGQGQGQVTGQGGTEGGVEGSDKKSEESGYSSSISDTVMKYLRIMRKNSKAEAKDAADRFKTVNYDRSLRYIKSKNVTLEEALEHEKNKALGLSGGGTGPEAPPPGESAGGEKKKAVTKKVKSPPPSSASPSGGEGQGPPSSGLPSPTGTGPSPTATTTTGDEKKEKTKEKVKKGVKGKVKVKKGKSGALVPGVEGTEDGAKGTEIMEVTEGEKTSEGRGSVSVSVSASSSPPPSSPPPLSSPPPPVEVGVQAGESLVRYLRKWSDTFPSYSHSSSPAEALSPRLSITTEGDFFLWGGGGMTSSSTARSSFSTFSLAGESSHGGSGSETNWEDAWVQQLLQYQQQFQQQQLQGEVPYWLLSPPQFPPQVQPPMTGPGGVTGVMGTGGTLQLQPQQVKGLSPIPASSGSSSSGGSLHLHHHPHQMTPTHTPQGSPTSYKGHLDIKIAPSSEQNKGHSSTPSTPSGTSVASLPSASGPFKSFFGLRSKVKPSSTTSLITPSSHYQTPGGMGGLGRSRKPSTTFGQGLPPTTCSSPNLLSLVHSPSTSRGYLGGGGQRDSSSSALGSIGGGMSEFLGSLGLGFGSSSKVPFKGSGGGGGGGGMAATAASTTHSPPSSVMQKSKSSSSVGVGAGAGGQSGERTPSSRLISKPSRIFKSRSKSTTRANSSSSGPTPSCAWAPQGKCRWRSPGGKTITLEATSALSLSEVERGTLQEVALEKLKALGLGSDIKVPKERQTAAKPAKRRPYLLKKKALSTGFFEGGKKEEAGKEGGGGSGAVFGISLSQCVANDRAKRGGGGGDEGSGAPPPSSASSGGGSGSVPPPNKRSQNGARGSVSVEPSKKEEKGSTESLVVVAGGKRGSTVDIPTTPKIPPESLLPSVEPCVPALVKACVEHLENYGLHTTGIFRVSTSLKRIRQLREEIDGGKEIQFGEEHSPHDVAALLKEFLRDLPDPLLSRELYQPFLRTQKIRNRKEQLEAMQHLVQLLPPANRDTLASLLHFFAKVVENAGETRSSSGEVLPGNRMEGYSLATLIAPNILPCMDGPSSSAGGASAGDQKERRESIDVVNYLISNHRDLFQVPPDLLHDVYLHLMDTTPEAVEGLLKLRTGIQDDPLEDIEAGSVFGEGSECGDEEPHPQQPPQVQRVFRRREDILHEGAARGGGPTPMSTPQEMGMSKRGVCRGRREESGEQSGAESDSSSTKSTSRWFRRSRPADHSNKARTSSDSGSEKKKKGGGLEAKRANSLDSVNLAAEMVGVSMSGSGGVAEKTASDQSLKVPPATAEGMNRRQSSPLLDTHTHNQGVITASLKIPVPSQPLSIDGSDIPFIEEDHAQSPRHYRHQPHPQPPARSRGRSASTDSSALVKSPSTTQPSSEVSSPVGFSPPASPPIDGSSPFPYGGEGVTARILLGSRDHPPPVTETQTEGKGPQGKVVTSLYLQPAANQNQGPIQATSTATVYIPAAPGGGGSRGSLRSRGEAGGSSTKGSPPIGGLIKSKTADFEKLAVTAPSNIAPQMRLRSQENIVLKQQFLLRQQQGGGGERAAAGHAQEEGRRGSTSRDLEQKKEKEAAPRKLTRSGSKDVVPLPRRRVLGSASSSCLTATPTHPQQHPPVSVTIRSTTLGQKHTQPKQPPQPQQDSPATATTTATATAGSSPSRWKRSEITSSRGTGGGGGEKPPSSSSGGGGPETFL